MARQTASYAMPVAELGHGDSLAGQLGIAQSAGVLARAERFFGIDSLLLHLARALGVPATSIWGPSDPATLAPARSDGRPSFLYQNVLFALHTCPRNPALQRSVPLYSGGTRWVAPVAHRCRN